MILKKSKLSAPAYESFRAYGENRISGRMIFTNGCFDVLHRGHIEMLEAARKLGDFLIVGLNSDFSVQSLKGPDRPVNKWDERAKVLCALRTVDVVIKFDEETPLKLIKNLRPNVITKGGDYQMDNMIGKDFVESYGGEVVILPYVEGYSSTRLIQEGI